jgi:hypothetical protein
MPSGAAQLPSHRGGRCRHCGAVMDCPAPQTRQPERGSGRPAGGRRRRGRPGCPDAGHGGRRWVRVRCSPCGRTSVQLVGRTSGVQATGVHPTGVIPGCPDGHASGVHSRCSRAVRTVLDPGIRRGGGTGHIGAPGWTCCCGGARLGRRCPNRAWREGMVERWPCVARTRVDARPGLPLGMRTGCGAALAARRPWEWSSAGAGRLAGEQGKERVLQVPRRCGLGRLPAYWPTMGLDREVVTTLRGRCAGVGPLSSRAGGPIRLSGE